MSTVFSMISKAVSVAYDGVVDYFKFIYRQLRHWQVQAYCLFYFGLGVQLMTYIGHPITWDNTFSFFGTVLGLACVIAISESRQINGLLGIINAILFITVAYHAHNYLNILINLGYVGSLDLPVLCDRNWYHHSASRIKHLDAKGWLYTLAGVAVAWLVSYEGVTYLAAIKFLHEPRPVLDSLTFAVSVVSGILCTNHISEQFYGWFFGSIVEVILWFETLKAGQANPALMISYMCYLANDVIGVTISPYFNQKSLERAIKIEQ